MTSKTPIRSIYEVFTPTTQARVNFIDRTGVAPHLQSALRTPGKQIVIYGESGSGKSTLLVNSLAAAGIKALTTRCSQQSTFESIVLDAFDQLDTHFVETRSSGETETKKGAIEAQFHAIKAQVGAERAVSSGTVERRVLPPQLTPQRLGAFMGEAGVSWILEDFHKVPQEHKLHLAQSLKIFSDLASDYPNLRIICLGATDTAREVVQLDKEMKNRVAEILVPLMSEHELRRILANGASLLNIDISKIQKDIVQFSAGLASATHALALNACLNAGVSQAVAIKIFLSQEDMKAALTRFIEESSDTIKALFDAALIRQRERRYDNTRLILTALANGPLEGMSHAEVRAHIRKVHPDYPSGNVTTYLSKLQTTERGELVQQAADGKYRFRDPIMHSYAMALFKVSKDVDPWSASLQKYVLESLTSIASSDVIWTTHLLMNTEESTLLGTKRDTEA